MCVVCPTSIVKMWVTLSNLLHIDAYFLCKNILYIHFKKLKIPWTQVIQGFISERIIGTSYEKVLQKTNQSEFRNQIVIKKKVISYMSNGKAMIIRLIAE